MVLFERNGSDQLMKSRQLFSYPRYKYRSSLHVVPWGVSQQLHIIVDHQMWSAGFCIKPGACAEHGVCSPSGCKCAASIRVLEIAPDAMPITMRHPDRSVPISSASDAQEMSRYVQLVEFARTTTRKKSKLGMLAPM